MKHLFKRIIVSILTLEARLLLRRKNPTIIAIAGSVGKTSTKDAIYAALKDSVPARKSQKSFNSEIGVPLTILGLQNGWSSPWRWLWNAFEGALTALFAQAYPSVLVLETGVDAPGDMSSLTSWLRPDVVVMTALPTLPVHIEQFDSVEALYAEEFLVAHKVKSGGVVIYNVDDQVSERLITEVRATTVGYSKDVPSAVRVTKVKTVYQDDRPVGVGALLKTENEAADVVLPGVLGTGQLYGCAAAVAAAQHLGVSLDQAAAGLNTLQSPPSRLRVLPGLKGSMLIDDSYNSSPAAVKLALDTMAELKYASRRILVLGDMLELGKYSAEEHERIGRTLPALCDVLITVGVRARGFAIGAQATGMAEANILQYETAERAGRELQQLLQPGDLVLIKGSQGVRTEKIVKEVMAEPEHAERLLARQDAAWQTIV